MFSHIGKRSKTGQWEGNEASNKMSMHMLLKHWILKVRLSYTQEVSILHKSDQIIPYFIVPVRVYVCLDEPVTEKFKSAGITCRCTFLLCRIFSIRAMRAKTVRTLRRSIQLERERLLYEGCKL